MFQISSDPNGRRYHEGMQNAKHSLSHREVVGEGDMLSTSRAEQARVTESVISNKFVNPRAKDRAQRGSAITSQAKARGSEGTHWFH